MITLESPIKDLELSTRINKFFILENMYFIKNLEGWTKRKLLLLPGFGKKSLAELYKVLLKNNIKLTEDGKIEEVSGND